MKTKKQKELDDKLEKEWKEIKNNIDHPEGKWVAHALVHKRHKESTPAHATLHPHKKAAPTTYIFNKQHSLNALNLSLHIYLAWCVRC